jgi:tetraacyldisaccharide 4'-kinase
LVIVGKDRHKASDLAARAGAQLILLDDGMQHRRLARDFEVVVMDNSDPFGQGYFLPRGLLREGVNSLSRADMIILNHTEDAEMFKDIKEKLQRYSKALVVGTRMEVVEVVMFNGEKMPSLQGVKVGIFCGIAHPEYFYKTVSQQGALIVDSAFAADHRCLCQNDLEKFALRCKEKGAELLLCTEKDKVKICGTQDLVLPIAWMKMRLNIVEGHEEWRFFMDRIKIDLKRRV